jgi:hypothetical protein
LRSPGPVSADASPGISLARLLVYGLSAACALLVVFTLGGPLLSGDLWWHLSNGRWMLNEGRLPSADPFSHTATTHAETQEYGSQLLFALVERWGGLLGLRILAVALGLTLLWAAWASARRRLPRDLAAAAVALLAALLALKWELRPHLLSALALLALEALLFPRRVRPQSGSADSRGPAVSPPEALSAPEAFGLPGPRQWLLLGLLACFWIQLHAEALFAPILAGIALLGAVLSPWIGPPSVGGRFQGMRAYGVAFCVALLGSALSPTFLDSHYYALFQRSVPELYIEEWFPSWLPPGSARFAPVTLGLFALFALAVLAGLLRGLACIPALLRRAPQGLPVARLAWLAACLLLAFKARRFFWLSWFPAIEVLAWLSLAAGNSARLWLRCARCGVALGLALGALLALHGSNYVRLQRENLLRGAYAAPLDERLFPVEATRRLASSGLSGNLYHPYEWGGYLGYWLWPACRVFIDGRTVMFADVIPERWRAERDSAFAQEVFAARDVVAIVMKRLVERDGQWVAWRPPEADSRWVRAYGDQTAELWIRADQDAALERLASDYAARGIPFDTSEGFVELAALAADPKLQQRWRLLPENVFAELWKLGLSKLAEPAPSGAPNQLSAREWLGLAECAQAGRLGRSARFALGQALSAAGESPAEVSAWLSAAKSEGLSAVLVRARTLLP